MSPSHHILLAFAAYKAFFFRGRHGAACHQVVKCNDLGTDEAALEIAVNFARSLRGLRALLNRPGAHLGLAGGQVEMRPSRE